jgi:hypothetical protein
MLLTRRTFRAAAAALAVMCAAAGALAYPRPAPVAPRWELQFEPGDLRLYVDPVDGDMYWYFNYTITNRTGRDQLWAPSFTLFTDTGEILLSGRGVPGRVAADLKELLGNELLEHQNEIIGEIYHGREHAKDGLVVWAARSLTVNEMSLFVAGTCGETATVVNPITGEQVLLRKSLKRDYLIPGEAVSRGSKPIEAVGETWVMR